MSVPTKHPEVWRALASPFDPGEVKTRNQGGRQLSFISARVAMNRLDEVLGPESWKDEYTETTGGLKCRIWFRLPDDPEWLWKEDGGAGAGMPEADNQEKSAYSDAFKRACVKLGVGRYLYRDGVADYSEDTPITAPATTTARPVASPPPAPSQPQPPSDPRPSNHGAPRTGRALFAWTKEMEEKHEVGLLKYLNNWGKLQDFPGRIVDWDEEQVKQAHAEASRKLESCQHPAPAPNSNNVGVAPTHDLPEPDGTIPRPKDGRELYGSAQEFQQQHGATIIRPTIAFMAESGVKGQFVSWTGADLDLAWRFVSAKAAEIAGPKPAPAKADKPPQINLDVWSKATTYLSKLFAVDRGQVAPEAVFAEINRVYGSLYQGEVIESFREFRDTGRLAELGRCLDELIAEQLELPAF